MQLPLFPLSTVLFPGATLNLHIFEQRYRLMIESCLDQQRPFGIVLLREGDEVEERRPAALPAVPYDVGTVVEIGAHVRLDDGRYLVSVVGVGRFRIEAIVQRLPYLIASAVLLPDEMGSAAEPAARSLRATYERYWQAVTAATGAAIEPEELPDETFALSCQLANRMQVINERKQHWLELDAANRMRQMDATLRAELGLLPRPGSRRDPNDWGGIGSLN